MTRRSGAGETTMRRIALALFVFCGMTITLPAFAQNAPDSDDGRFSINRAGDGYLRLDSRTGQVSLCTRRAVGWACQAVPDERVVLESEIARLQAENGVLKKELLAHNVPLPAGVSSDRTPPAADGPRLRLPDDADINRIVSFVGQVWRRLVELMVRFQNDVLKRA
jgi:hypothetical protein